MAVGLSLVEALKDLASLARVALRLMEVHVLEPLLMGEPLSAVGFQLSYSAYVAPSLSARDLQNG